MNYLNFDLSIETVDASPGYYQACVRDSPAGQAEARFKLPFSPQELEILLLSIGRPQRGVRKIDSPEMARAKDFGIKLYRAIFQDQVQGCLLRSLDAASDQAYGLRIRLRLTKAPTLTGLPWEYLYDPINLRFFLQSNQTPLVRYLDLPQKEPPLAVQPPLKILVMIASPSDYSKLDAKAEWRKIQKALDDLLKRGLVTLTRLKKPTLTALRHQLSQDQYHIFHFVGHGGLDQQTQEGVLLLEDDKGLTRRVSGSSIGTFLHDHRSLRLAVINACEGARAAPDDPFAGVAQTLVQQGIPAVIAMQFEITDQAAIIFASEFYSALAKYEPVDTALAEARKAILAEGNDVEWGTPVLFMRSSDGRIFDRAVVIEQQTESEHQGMMENQSKEDDMLGRRKSEDVKLITSLQSSEAVQPNTQISTSTPRTPLVARQKEPDVSISGDRQVAEGKNLVTPTKAPYVQPIEAIHSETQATAFTTLTTALIQKKDPEVKRLGENQVIEATKVASPTQLSHQQPTEATQTVIQTTTPATQSTSVSQAQKSAQAPKILSAPIEFGWVTIPEGEFLMGTEKKREAFDYELPQHKFSVSEFCIARVPVTVAQFEQFIKATKYKTLAEMLGSSYAWKVSKRSEIDRNDTPTTWKGPEQVEMLGVYWASPRGPGSDIKLKAQHPVTCISWPDALAFCEWAKVRLLTEAEWEKAARGLDGRHYPWGNEAPDKNRCNYNVDVGDTTPVTNYPQGTSPYGVLDMAGNIREWTSTKWLPNYLNYASKVDNSLEGAESRVLRGSGFNYRRLGVCCAFRTGAKPSYRSNYVGFRVASLP